MKHDLVMDQPGLDEAPARFALTVFWINGLLMRAGEQTTMPLGQSSARWQVLGRAGFAPQTVAQMAREQGQARQSVQRVVNDLRRDGLVRLEAIPHDQRTALVTLTPAGHEVLAAIYERNSQWAQRISGRISDERFDTVIGLLQQIGAILEEETHED
jgi:DNA-binding MarR family transcriptional regulator